MPAAGRSSRLSVERVPCQGEDATPAHSFSPSKLMFRSAGSIIRIWVQAAVNGTSEAAGAGDGGPARPRGGMSGHLMWTANQIPSGWTVIEIPSRVSLILTVRSRLGGQDSLEAMNTGKEFLRNPPAEPFFVAKDPYPPLPDPFLFPATSRSHLPTRWSEERGGGVAEKRRKGSFLPLASRHTESGGGLRARNSEHPPIFMQDCSSALFTPREFGAQSSPVSSTPTELCA